MKIRIIFLGLTMFFSHLYSYEINEKQEKSIEFILNSLGNNNALTLIRNSFYLNSCGKEIMPIPPLDFLLYILKDKKLTQYLRDIDRRSFSSYQFISGFSKKCNKKDNYNKIIEDLEYFSTEMDVDSTLLEKYVDQKNWKGFIRYLIYQKTY